MNTANLSRYVLLAAIAAIGFMLLVEFNQFKNERQRNAIVATNTTTATTSVTPTPASTDFPQPAAVTPPTGDIPQPPASSPSAAVTSNSQQLVHVQTDVLDLYIDLHGGDIVRASLPAHLARLDTPDQAFVLLDQSPRLTYIAQSGLVGPQGTDTPQQRPVFRSASNTYTLGEHDDVLHVDLLLAQTADITLTKRFTLRRDSYQINVDYLINNNSGSVWQAALYGQLKRDSSRDPSAEDGRFGVQPFLGVASTTDDTRFAKVDFSDLPDEKFSARKTDGWIAVIQHYFLGAWVPEKGVPVDYAALQSNGFNYARFTTPLTSVSPGAQGVIGASLYLGPKDQYTLEKIADNLDLSVDYGWLWWMAQPLFWVLNMLHGLLGNWGFAIIGLTVLIKALFFPLSAASYRSMANMRRVQPKLVELKERYGDDRQKMSQAMMELYRKEKINPLGGCLPILIQMPVFIALYWVLLESVELRHAPFIGYIHDLSAMDPYFIMPLIMGASMFFQQKLNPPPPDPMQAKIMQWMPVVFTVFFLWFPSGLVLYWVVNNILSISQQWVITRNIERAAAGA